MAVRAVPLDRAIEQFVNATGLAVVYDPGLVSGRQVSCARTNETAERILQCLLRESDLDYYRLSSGTYVLTVKRELKPQRGYLSGVVTDRENGYPLAYAHVWLQEASLGSVTNQSGRFVFPPLLPGRYAMRVSYVGYQSWDDTLVVKPNDRTFKTAMLAAEPVLITPVVIDGIQPRRLSEDLGRGKIDLNGSSVAAAGETGSGYQSMDEVPGVRINDLTADVHVQGGDTGEHEMRLDGVPVYLPRSIASLISPFSSFALGPITVHKAGFDATRGSQIASVIETRHRLEAQNRVSIQADPLSLNAGIQVTPHFRGVMETSVMTAARVGIWDVFAPAAFKNTLSDWSRLDLFLVVNPTSAPVSNNVSPLPVAFPDYDIGVNPTVHFSDVHVATRLRIDPLRSISASFYRGSNHLDGGHISDPLVRSSYLGNPLVTLVDSYDWLNGLAQISYESVLGNRTLFKAQLKGSRYALAHDYDVLDSLTVTNFNTPVAPLTLTQPLNDENRINTLGAESSIDFYQGRHQVNAGVEALRTESSFSLHGVRFATFNDRLDGVASEYVDEHLNVNQQAVSHAPVNWRIGSYVNDVVSLSRGLQLEAGMRLTYVPERATVYAEPRLAFRVDRSSGLLGPWASRTAAGLYRQYTLQVDLSTLNAGSLLPSVRVWLPLDETVRPPLAYHFMQELIFQPVNPWSLHLEGYYKYQLHGLTIRYASVGQEYHRGVVRNQSEFLASTRGDAYGGAISIERKGRTLQVKGRYEYNQAWRRSSALFEGRAETVPWNEPHRVELGLDWKTLSHLTFSSRWRGIWGRSWGFRQAYYDYYGHAAGTRYQGEWDLGSPSEHRLPALYTLDAGLAYTLPIDRAALQFRIDVLNVLDTRNVADWSLVFEGTELKKQPRYLYPRMFMVAVRTSF